MGQVAGTVDGKGYSQIGIKGRLYRGHHLVWLYHTGVMPKMLDHINRNRLDNRIENLRTATLAQNHANRTKVVGCTSKHKGVSRHQCGWQAQTKVNGVPTHLGVFGTEEEAAQVYQEFMRERFGDYFNP